MNGSSLAKAIALRPAAMRSVGLLVFWIILSGGGPSDLLPGVVVAAAAAWVSLRLLPPGKGRIRPWAAVEFGMRFLAQSIVAGADVARRALDPRLPLDPGFVQYSSGLPPGPARNAFTTLMSLLPGTLPLGPDKTGALVIHCLDVAQPVAAQLAAEEALLVRAIGGMRRDG